jgi:NADPH:quinone reductase
MAMRAAVIERYGEPPVVRDVPEPKGEGAGLIQVTAGALNPVDLTIGSGKFYAGSPPTPYVPGGEGVGRQLKNGQPGPRVFFRAMLPNGAFAERAIARDEPVPIPDAVPDGVAAALGTPAFPAYFGLTKLARMKKGETVLILAASGVLGTIAVQLARLLGAGHVIAAARDERGLARAKELGADATVDLKQAEGLTERISEASSGRLDVVLDPLWGIPGAAAMEALSPHGRFVQIGASAGNEAVIKSGIVRGRFLSIFGFTTFLMPWKELAAAYRQLVAYAAAGQLKVDFEVLPLEAVPEAWKRQASSPHRKLVISPQAGR